MADATTTSSAPPAASGSGGSSAPAPTLPTSTTPSPSASATRRGLLFLVLALLVGVGVWSMAAVNDVLLSNTTVLKGPSDLGHLHGTTALDGRGRFVPYPESIYREDWSQRLPKDVIPHLNALHRLCMTYEDSVIPWTAGREGQSVDDERALLINETDPRLYERLAECPDVDVLISSGLRGSGYCEDAMAYTKFLQSRMLPRWVLDKPIKDPTTGGEIAYHELCPHTPLIVFNHYWSGVRSHPKWPATKKLYLMPNLEMHELQAEQYWLADVVLCKTEICERNMRIWHEQQGNPNNTQVIYTRHTTTDITAAAREALGDGIRPKDFENMTIVHTSGGSIQKGTPRVLNCWLKRPDLPTVDIYIAKGLYDGNYKDYYDDKIKASPNIRLHVGKADAVAFGKIIAEASMFMCTSIQEGYGHYINHARASGGLILTPDVPPMSELVTPTSGVLIRAKDSGNGHQFLCGYGKHPNAVRNVTGCIAQFGGDEVCAAVDEALGLSPAERRRRGERARQQYFFDTLFFAQKMEELRVLARTSVTSSTLQKQKHLRDGNSAPGSK